MRLTYLLLYLFLLLISGSLLSQSDYRIIGPTHRIKASIPSNFYVQKIEDDRPFQSNFGIVNRGHDLAWKRALMPKVGFFDQVKQMMNEWITPQAEAKPVVAQVEELYIWEDRRINAGEGHIRLKVAFAEPGSGEAISVSVELFGEEVLVSEGHAPRLEEAFFRTLQQFGVQQAGYPPARRVAGRNKVSPDDLQAATSFLDLWAGRCRRIPARLEASHAPGLYRYELHGPQRQPYYALVQGEEWFIKANTYFGTGQHYTKVLEKGRYLFLIDEQPANFLAELGLSQARKRLGIVIDMQTGLPVIVDDAFMKKLMAPYPDLQQRYLFKAIQKYPVQLNRVRNVIAEVNRREENS